MAALPTPPRMLPSLLRRAGLLAALLLALPTATASALPTPGVNLDGIPSDAQIDQAAALGARTARMFVLWSDLEPRAPAGGTHHYDAFALGRYDQIVDRLAAHGMKPVFVITASPAWASATGAGGNTPPRDPAAYAAFARDFAARYAGRVAAYEIWNEEDGSEFWSTGADPARYAALLRAGYPAIKGADRQARVLFGPLTGNDYDFLERAYQAGAKGSFDGVSVHTDTACLDRGPDSFYRDPATGRIAPYTFLGYREVHQTMLAHGDDKPIWMSELGWSTTTTRCGRGLWAGQKPAGVTEAAQGAYLEQAFHCMASDPYLEGAIWYTQRDLGVQDAELTRYGLVRPDGSHKPSWDAFRTVATQGDTLQGPCGDFSGPKLSVLKPTAGSTYSSTLVIAAAAHDDDGLFRIKFIADGKVVINYGTGLGTTASPRLDWHGAKHLALGRHTITIEARDTSNNVTTTSVRVVKTRARAARATVRTTVAATKLARRGLLATVSGRVRAAAKGVRGTVRASWQAKVGRNWVQVHAASRPAGRPFRFRQRLAHRGLWRVRVEYLGRTPLRASRSTWRTFRAT